MTKLQKIAISICVVGLVGVKVNAFELPYKPYQTQMQQIQNNDKVATIKARIKITPNAKRISVFFNIFSNIKLCYFFFYLFLF